MMEVMEHFFDPLFLSGVIKTSYTEVTIFKAVNNTGKMKLDYKTVAWTRSLDVAWTRSLERVEILGLPLP